MIWLWPFNASLSWYFFREKYTNFEFLPKNPSKNPNFSAKRNFTQKLWDSRRLAEDDEEETISIPSAPGSLLHERRKRLTATHRQHYRIRREFESEYFKFSNFEFINNSTQKTPNSLFLEFAENLHKIFVGHQKVVTVIHNIRVKIFAFIKKSRKFVQKNMKFF